MTATGGWIDVMLPIFTEGPAAQEPREKEPKP